MYLSSDVHICDIDHQNNSQFMLHVNRSFNLLREKNHLVVESHRSEIIFLKDLKIPQKCDLAFPMPLILGHDCGTQGPCG